MPDDTDSPLSDDPGLEARIRERAYHLWEQDGRPHGGDLEFWEKARFLVGIESNPGAGQVEPVADPVVDEAELEENLGEFPGRMTDQGERLQSPMVRRRKRA